MSWKERRLGDVLTLKRGYDLPEAQRRPGDVPVISSSGITGSHNMAMVAGPGVVTGRYGTMGEVFYVEGDYWPHNTALYVRDFKGNNPRFIAYFLKNALRGTNSNKAAVPGVNRNDLHERKVCSPDLETQGRVVEQLLPIDDLIENNRRRIALLEQSARLLYREWFVHLRFPGHEHVKVVDGVPEGWERTTLGDVAENHDRLRVPLSVLEREKRQGAYPYYGAASLLDHVDGYLFDGRYLLLGEDGTVVNSEGAPMLQLVDGKFWVNNHAHVLTGKKAGLEFLYCCLSSYKIQGHITGVAQPKITQANMNRIPVLLPSESVMTDFQSSVKASFDQRFVLERLNETLRQARDLLLPRLMSGDLVV